MVSERPSLTNGDLDEVWDLVRQRLERKGIENRGRVTLPTLTAPARLTLSTLVGRPVRTTVDLGVLEAALRQLDVGANLAEALASLEFPVSDEPARRRAEREVANAAKASARSVAASWPEPWAPTWADEMIRAGCLRGLDEAAALQLLGSVRAVLDHLDVRADEPDAIPISRVDLAAQLLGSSHALDPGSRIEAATTRALAHRLGAADARDLWERAGAHLDLTSGPALTWLLPLVDSCGLAGLVRRSVDIGIPLHLTQFALRKHPVEVPSGCDVLVVENPRLVEAAAQSDSTTAMVAANGNPSGAVRLLIDQLLCSGANVAYHGDFDAAGLAICHRMHQLGLRPWRMTARDYLVELALASSAGIELPQDASPSGPTPWDPELSVVFNQHRLVVHEERLLPGIIER